MSDITFTLEVTGNENTLDATAHEAMLNTGTAIREALNDAGIAREKVTIAFFGDNLLEHF